MPSKAISMEKLNAVAALAPQASPSRSSSFESATLPTEAGSLRVADWLNDRGVPFRIKETPTADGRVAYLLNVCPFNPDHCKVGEVAIMQSPSGQTSFKCFHNSCSGHSWQDVKQALGSPASEHYDWPPVDETCLADFVNGVSMPEATSAESQVQEACTSNPPEGSGIGENFQEATVEAEPVVDPAVVDRLIETAPRFIRETVEWILSIAHRKQPWLALGAALAQQGILAGRRIRDERNCRTNPYIVGVCGSGRGKDAGRQALARILEAAGADDLIGPDALTSGAAVSSHLDGNPAVVFQLDEFGRMLVTMGNPAKSPHLYELATILMRLKTSGHARNWKGKGYADTAKNVVVGQPHVVLHATTTQSRLFEALTGADVLDGSIARMLFFFGDEDPPEPNYRRKVTGDPPESVVKHAAAWKSFEPEFLRAAKDSPDIVGSNNLQGLKVNWWHPDPLVIPHNDDAMDLTIDWNQGWDACIKVSEQFAPLWSRAGEHAAGLALIACAGREIPTDETRITLGDVEWAYELTDVLVRGLVEAVRDHIADGPADRLRKTVVRYVTRRPGISRSELLKKTKASRRDLDEAVDWLSETAEIKSDRGESGPHGGRPKLRYYPKGYQVQQQ